MHATTQTRPPNPRMVPDVVSAKGVVIANVGRVAINCVNLKYDDGGILLQLYMHLAKLNELLVATP